MNGKRLKYVTETQLKGGVYLYYRRGGQLVRLPGVEGSPEFLAAYDRVHAEYGQPRERVTPHTVGAAISGYLASADFTQLANATQRQYRQYLGEVTERWNSLPLSSVTVEVADGLRDILATDPHRWNRIRSLLRHVWKRYRRLHRGVVDENPWDETDRISVEQSDQNRPWPNHVLSSVMQAATPEFRALLVSLLLTSQRLGDVIKFGHPLYDEEQRTLNFIQSKTSTPMSLHVPGVLAAVFGEVAGRHPTRLLVTPRGKAWTEVNAQETLLTLRRILGLPRYTLHGLRATGPTALAQGGAPLAVLMALTGHSSERNLRIYLRGVERTPLAKEAQEGLVIRFEPVLNLVGNSRSYAGTTGRAAAKLKREAECQTSAKRQTEGASTPNNPIKKMASRTDAI